MGGLVSIVSYSRLSLMIIALRTQFHVVGAFNQEKALVGAFSVIVKTGCGTDGALQSTSLEHPQISSNTRL